MFIPAKYGIHEEGGAVYTLKIYSFTVQQALLKKQRSSKKRICSSMLSKFFKFEETTTMTL